MRVALVCPFDPRPDTSSYEDAHVGGVERALWQVASRIAARGHDVDLLCSTDGADGEGMDEGVRVLRRHRRFTLFRAPWARLSRHLPKEADVVHVAATYPFTTASVLKRARRLGIPLILDFHFEPQPGTALSRMAARAYGRLGPRAYPLADAVLVRSLSYGRSARSLARVPEAKWRVVPNGVDPDRFHPNGGAPTRDYLLFVGRLVSYKGIPVLLRALAKMRDAPPLLIAGDGPLRASLQDLASFLDVDVEFLGHVPDRDLPSLYRGALLTLLPSVNQQEAFGISLLESMACGTPVVASRLPGVEDVASLGGLLADVGDPESLSTQIRAALASEQLPRGWDLAGPIHESYSWDAVTDRVLRVYDEVRGVHRPPAPPPIVPEVMPDAHPRGHPILSA